MQGSCGSGAAFGVPKAQLCPGRGAGGLHSPAQRDLDGGGEAGGEEVSRQVWDHGQQLVGLTGCQLDAVLHGGGQRHLGKGVVGVNGSHLQRTRGEGSGNSPGRAARAPRSSG